VAVENPARWIPACTESEEVMIAMRVVAFWVAKNGRRLKIRLENPNQQNYLFDIMNFYSYMLPA
jgi:hypothetical protein